VAEGARLESVYTRKRIQGSNPCLSANFFSLLTLRQVGTTSAAASSNGSLQSGHHPLYSRKSPDRSANWPSVSTTRRRACLRSHSRTTSLLISIHVRRAASLLRTSGIRPAATFITAPGCVALVGQSGRRIAITQHLWPKGLLSRLRPALACAFDAEAMLPLRL
jgi:hypothetical protein